jgi:hypothetical protein
MKVSYELKTEEYPRNGINHKVGEKIRFKTTEEDWKSDKKWKKYSKAEKAFYLTQGEEYKEMYGKVLTVEDVEIEYNILGPPTDRIFFKVSNNKYVGIHESFVIKIEK